MFCRERFKTVPYIFLIMISIESKLVSLQSLKKKLIALRRQGKTIAFTNGCFDLMHIGHVKYLQAAKKKDRVLIVGLNSDKSISAIKGPSRPVCPQKSRAAVLAALECVDFVVVFNEETPYTLIKAVQPDILIKGADWKGKDVVGSDIAKKVELIKYIDGFSTTNIINRILGKTS
ncbi:MAG: adenylyltransferase/cytidyltransferase family protein [Candidatus Omnitrophica bacterium]|nr:adenylyltransferase/cytidyltransferase family protein [Candidatus Omnitrophota bacterium]